MEHTWLIGNPYLELLPRKGRNSYQIPIKIRAPQISRLFNFRIPLYYYKVAVFPFIRGTFSYPFNFRAFVLLELTPFNVRAPLFYYKVAVFSFIRGIFSSPFNFRAYVLREIAPFNFRDG